MLFINGTFCSSIEQLRNYFSMELVPGSSLYEELLTSQRDGELAKWLAEGNTKDEIELSKILNNIPTDIPNSEIINRLKQIFVGKTQKIRKPHFSSYIELQQIRCLANGENVNLEEYDFHKYQGIIKSDTKKYKAKFYIDFRILKTDNELFNIDLLGKYQLSLKDKSVGQIVSIETKPSFCIGDEIISLSVDNETIGLITLMPSEMSIKVGDVKIEMVRVESGTFTMGATVEQGSDAGDNEEPTHQVTLSTYYIAKYEVTQELWQAVMGSNPSKLKGAQRPVENVSWDDCQEFIGRLNQQTGQCFRLPTEAEWEFAARGGKDSKGYKYAGSNNLDDVAWYDGNGTHPVGHKQPNELGLYDMSGNVWEWCQDWYGDYSSNAQTNPTGPSSGLYRVNRGGGCYDNTSSCRSSYRSSSTPWYRIYDLGLRLALNSPKDENKSIIERKEGKESNDNRYKDYTFETSDSYDSLTDPDSYLNWERNSAFL